MPSRNVSKEQVADSYYHVYARGSNKQKIFLEAADYKYFLSLLERYLSSDPASSKMGEPYPSFHGKVNLLAYCLMTNHFHLFVRQEEVGDLTNFMRSLMTSYSRYFNLKYKRTGSLYESRYKAARLVDDSHFLHISRYVHLNPRLWRTYRYSSLRYYLRGSEPSWLDTAPVLAMFDSREDYQKFVADYEEQRDMLAELKSELANQTDIK